MVTGRQSHGYHKSRIFRQFTVGIGGKGDALGTHFLEALYRLRGPFGRTGNGHGADHIVVEGQRFPALIGIQIPAAIDVPQSLRRRTGDHARSGKGLCVFKHRLGGDACTVAVSAAGQGHTAEGLDGTDRNAAFKKLKGLRRCDGVHIPDRIADLRQQGAGIIIVIHIVLPLTRLRRRH